MYGWKNILSKKGVTSEVVDTVYLTTPSFVKTLRNKLDFSQRLFAKVLGVSEKTIEKWEQGANPVKGAASKLLYLLDGYPSLIDDLYKVKDLDEVYENKYQINFIKNKSEVNVDQKIGYNPSRKSNIDLIQSTCSLNRKGKREFLS